jgi:hypothetical protein
MTKLYSIYVIFLNNMIFQNLGHRSVKNRSNTETRRIKIGHDLHIEQHSNSDLNYFKAILTEK